MDGPGVFEKDIPGVVELEKARRLTSERGGEIIYNWKPSKIDVLKKRKVRENQSGKKCLKFSWAEGKH